jgi:hypothetical protein
MRVQGLGFAFADRVLDERTGIPWNDTHWTTFGSTPPSQSAYSKAGGNYVLKFRVYTVALLFVLLLGGVNFANAQSGDVYFGVGSVTDKSSGQMINTFGGDTLYSTPRMGGAFGTFGAGYMLRPTVGVGFEYTFRFAQDGYAGLNYRPKFYDFNAIWMPISNTKPVAPEFQAGLGAASLSFYYPQLCNQFACSSSSYLVSSHHFQTHLSAGLRIYVKGAIFIRPQVDIRYVRNFYQFGSNWAPQYSVAIGYTFGRQ